MSNVGYATLTVLPSAKGFASALSGEISGPLAGAGRDAGQKSGGHFAGAFKGLVGPALALVGAGMFGGFIKEAAAASDATDKFKATMSFAGLKTDAIDKATKAAKQYADQTVFDLPTIQNTIAQLASNGIKDYTGLTKAAGNLNAVAGGNADTFKSVSMVLTQTAGAGKLTTENWNQMADAIPGAAGPLMKAMKDAGAFTGNFRDAMAAGEITSDEFNAALMKLGNQPVAVEAAKSTKTFEGALGSLQATLVGGLTSALNAMKPALTGAINFVTGALGNTFEWIGNAVSGLGSLFGKGDFTGAFRKAFHVEEDSSLVDFLFKIRDGAIEASKMWTNFKTGFTLPNIDTTGLTGPLATAINVGVKARGVVDTVAGGFKAMFAAFKAGDGDVTSSGFAGFMEQLGNTARTVFDAIGPSFAQLFSTLAAAIGPLIPQVLALWSNLSPLGTVFQALAPFIPTLIGLIGQLASTIGAGLMQAITAVLPFVSQLQALFVDVLGQALTTIIPAVVQMVGMLGSTISALVPVIMPVITTILGLVTTLIGQLAPIIMDLVSSVLPPVVEAFGMILGAIGPVIQMIAGVLVPVIQALMPVVVTIFGVIANVIKSAMQIVLGIIKVVTGIISGNWDQVWSGIRDILAGVWNTIKAVVTGAVQVVASVIGAALGLIGQLWSGAWNGISSFLSGVWNSITSGVSNGIGEVVKFFSGLIGKITGAIGDAGKALWDTGVHIIQGLIDGIGSMMGAIGRAVLQIVPEAIRGPFEQLLGIHSPSRVFRSYGVNIGEGLVLGIKDKYGDVEKAVNGLAPKAPTFRSPDVRAGGIQGSLDATVNALGKRDEPTVIQNIHPRENMSEETLAELAARKIVRRR